MIKKLVLIGLIGLSLQIDHCKTEAKICKACHADYTLVKYDSISTECIKTTDYNKIKDITENCIKADVNFHTCYYCSRGYALDEEKSKCVEGAHCKTMRSEVCSKCYTPFVIDDDDKKCKGKPLCKQIDKDKCKDCEDYYYPNDSGDCTRIPITNCKIGDDKKCTECNKAISYLDDSTHCKSLPEHCINFDHDKKECITCADTFYLKDKLECASIGIDKCLKGKPDACTECDKTISYLDDPKTCKPLPQNCIYFDHDKKECITCADTFYLKDKLECASIGIGNCLQGKPDECTKCKDGFGISDDKKSCIKICTEEETLCQECKDNYESYDYGATCTVQDKDKEPQPEPQPQDNARFNSLDLIFIVLIL